MAQIPAVYVTIEDKSFAIDSPSTGRYGLVVVFGDRGEHNKVVEVNSQEELYLKFGRPNIEKTGQPHYLADKFLQGSNRLLVIRPVLFPSEADLLSTNYNNDNYHSIANVFLRFNSNSNIGKSEIIGRPIDYNPGDPDFDKHRADVTFRLGSPYVYVTREIYESVNLGGLPPDPNDPEYLLASIDESYPLSRPQAPTTISGTTNYTFGSYVEISGHSQTYLRIIEKNIDENGKYRIVLENKYYYSSTSPLTNNKASRYPHNPIPQTNNYQYDVPGPGDIIGYGYLTDPTVKVAIHYEDVLNVLVTADTITIGTDTYTLISSDRAVSKTGISGDITYKALYEYSLLEASYLLKYYPHAQKYIKSDSSDCLFNFVYNSNLVSVADLTNVKETWDLVLPKDWIYPNDSAYDGTLARQVVDKYIEENSDGTKTYYIVLDEAFSGSTISGVGANKYTILETDSIANKRDFSFDTTDDDNFWYLHAVGAGSYYNNVYVQGVRNVAFEKMYTDNDGNPLYKYAFMDLFVYHQNADGTSTLLEGPWTVSLIKNTLKNEIVRDIYTGNELYIETVINTNSNVIRCVASQGSEKLLTNKDAELLRLNVLSMFANEQVYKLNTLGYHGIMMDMGEDGCQYDSMGRLNLDPVTGITTRLPIAVYDGQIISEDGSIENLDNVLYPTFTVDYILAGGLSQDAQSAAYRLGDKRQDCLVLADTGINTNSASNDLAARIPTASSGSTGISGWNSWNTMVYVQYQKLFDSFTGKYIWLSPTYHAIERHLYVDAQYWIAEPVAGIEKGAITTPITLAYRPSVPKLQDLVEVELNPVIVEPDGTYILTQLTTWKRLSIMKRAHAVKFIHFVRKSLPPLLKDILQRKMTAFWVNMANQRINAFLSKYVEGANGNSERFVALRSFDVNVTPDEARSELDVILTLKPIRAIEAINVHIIVT